MSSRETTHHQLDDDEDVPVDPDAYENEYFSVIGPSPCSTLAPPSPGGDAGAVLAQASAVPMAFIPLQVVVAREEALQERARLAVGAVQAQAQTVVSYAQGHVRAEISEAHDQQRAQIHTLEAQAQAYARSIGP